MSGLTLPWKKFDSGIVTPAGALPGSVEGHCSHHQTRRPALGQPMKPLEVVIGQPHAGVGQEHPGVSRVKGEVAGAKLQEPPPEAQLRQRQGGWLAA